MSTQSPPHGTFDPAFAAEVIATAAHNAFRFAQTSRGALPGEYARLASQPRIGDLVVEISATERPAVDRVGKLTSVSEDERSDLSGECRSTVEAAAGQVFTLLTLRGHVLRWSQCRLIRADVTI